jgi:ParB family chromosome partitioning protein
MGEPAPKKEEKAVPEAKAQQKQAAEPVSSDGNRTPQSPEHTEKQVSEVPTPSQSVSNNGDESSSLDKSHEPSISHPDAVLIEEADERAVEAQDEKEAISNAELEDHVVIKSVKTRSVSTQQENSQAPQTVAIDSVHPNPDQPRSHFKKEELEELADSITNNGLLQPILVRKVEDGYQIIAGERRWQASKLAGLEEIPILVLEADDDKVIELAMIENIQRSDLNPIEEAYGYRRLMERKKLTQSQLAQLVSKGRSTIANSLRLLDLPEDAQQLLYEEKITAGHARAILSIPTMEGRKQLTRKLMEKPLSVRDAENLARLIAGREKGPASSSRPVVPKEYKLAAKNLSKELDTKVRVKISGGKNRLEIEFADQEQLEAILDRFSQ